jgi:hypothetical protein
MLYFVLQTNIMMTLETNSDDMNVEWSFALDDIGFEIKAAIYSGDDEPVVHTQLLTVVEMVELRGMLDIALTIHKNGLNEK